MNEAYAQSKESSQDSVVPRQRSMNFDFGSEKYIKMLRIKSDELFDLYQMGFK